MGLSFDQVSTFLKSLHPLCDEMWSLSEGLAAQGFGAHVPRQRFIESFSESDDDVDQHRKIYTEKCKERFSKSSRPFLYIENKANRHYPFFRSEYLDELRIAADRLHGRSICWDSPKWTSLDTERGLDPCEANQRKMSVNHPAEYEDRFEQMIAEEYDIFRSEAESQSNVSRNFETLDYKTSVALIKKKLSLEHSELAVSTKLSRKNLIYEGSLIEEWRVYCGPESTKDWIWPQRERLPWSAYPRISFGSHLHIAREASGTRALLSGERVVVNIDDILPDFWGAYARFGTLADLERCLAARLVLFGKTYPMIKANAIEMLTT